MSLRSVQHSIRFILVETSHPGNIGAAARAMKNMSFGELYLVAPHHFPHAEATARASGADDLLAQARVCASLSEALEGCQLVYGTSARERTIAWPRVDPHQCAASIARRRESTSVALVFGRERSGLRNDELDLCHQMLHIPCNPNYCSLNLGAAVQVIAYELYMAGLGVGAGTEIDSDATPASVALCGSECGGASESPPEACADRGDPVSPEYRFDTGERLARHEEMSAFYAHLQRAITASGFFDPDNPRQLPRRLRRLFKPQRAE